MLERILNCGESMRDVHDAVAELMEAARAAEFHLSRRHLAPTTIDAADYTVEMEHDLRTLRAAIAKATGVAA